MNNTPSTTKSGSLFGGILLVAGCCIGAGMLGLPVLSALAGFQPSVVIFILSWIFMATTGLLVLEVNLWFKDEVNIVSMASRTLGLFGKVIAWGLFLFLFYSLMVAYGAGSGELFTDFIADNVGLRMPSWVGCLSMIVLFGLMLFLGTRAVDHFNRLLMLGLAVSYLLIVLLGAPHVQADYLQHRDWGQVVYVIPVMIISFGYHNLIPSLTTYLGGDGKRLRLIILIGSAIPLFVYLLWEWLILGLVPLEGKDGFLQALNNGDMATHALRQAVGYSWIGELAQYFAFFAIVTSFLGVALSFVDFLADGLSIKKTAQGRLLLCLLALVPPFVFAIVYPKVFLVALNYAGGFGAVILFGIMPALMVWSGRYRQKLEMQQQVPGGKIALIAIIVFSLAVFAIQLWNEIGRGIA